MASPPTSTSPDDSPSPRLQTSSHRSQTIDVIEHRVDSGFRSLESYTKRNRQAHSLSIHERVLADRPYLEYVQQLVAAGWSNFKDLDDYMSASRSPHSLIVSVLDISNDLRINRWPDIYNELDLKNFFATQKRNDVRVRFCVAEYQGNPSADLIEVLGGALKLDPRFFKWSIHSKGHVFTPSQRHQAPYVSLGFGILDNTTRNKTDAEKFKVMVYIQPDEGGKDWTGIVLVSSRTKMNVSPRILTDPPLYGSPLPPSIQNIPKSLREMYLESIEFLNLSQAIASPFYAVSNLFRMNCFLWNQIITSIREEDRRINGISDTSVGHSEEIKRTWRTVQRGGSTGWAGRDEQTARQSQAALEEDFKHLVDQTDLLWQTRDKMTAIRQRNSDLRWTSLTNVFTYIFAPVTIMTGVYGMNVSQISGSTSNPNIWQFFVAVIVFNVAVLLALATSNWLHIQSKHKRTAGVKEILGFAVGRMSNK